MKKGLGILIGIIIIILVFLLLRAQSVTAPMSKTQPTTQITEKRFSIELKGGKTLSPGQTFTITQGDQALFTVTSDTDGAMHFHSGENEVQKAVIKDNPNTFQIPTDKAGSYTIEFHPGAKGKEDKKNEGNQKEELGESVGTLVISPK